MVKGKTKRDEDIDRAQCRALACLMWETLGSIPGTNRKDSKTETEVASPGPLNELGRSHFDSR